MAFDNFVLGAITSELQTITGAKINKIAQPDKFTVIFKFYAAGKNGRLLISAHPQNARIHLSSAESENPMKAPVFCMVMRKYLEGSRLIKITQEPHERIIYLDFAYINSLGDEAECRLIVELMGKHSNIILINDHGIIIDGIRRYTHAVSRYRQVLPNESYLPPPPQQKSSWEKLDTSELAELLLQEDLDCSCKKSILNKLAGFSPFAAEDICQRAGLMDKKLDELGAYETEKLHTALKLYTSPNYTPHILKENGVLKDLYCYLPLAWQEAELMPFNTMNAACDYFYGNRGANESFDAQKRELLKIVRSFAEKSGKKLEAQNDELAEAQNGDEWKEQGDLLAANMYQLTKGMDSIILPDFYHDNEMRTVTLDPILTPQENLGRCYRRYNKAKNASKEIIKQVESTSVEYEYLLSVETESEEAQNTAELEEIKEELREGGYLKEQKKGKQKAAALPPLEVLSDDGMSILIGRNNKQNDMLTLKIAAKNDIWLHTQKIHGAHVIIRSDGRKISQTTLELAASLAALHSKAKNGTKVPVDYTEVAQVKKPNGAKPGMVIYFKQQTILAEPYLQKK